MQENNFEKQVQQKMDELSLSPSAEVWQKLSVSIAKDTGNRRFFIILFLLLLLLSSTVYLIFNKQSNKEYQIASTKENVSNKLKNSSIPLTERNGIEFGNDTSSIINSDRSSTATGTQQQSGSTIQNEKADGETNDKVAKNTFSLSRENRESKKNNLEAAPVDKAKKPVYKKDQQVSITVSENTPDEWTEENLGAIESNHVKENANRNAKKEPLSINDIVTTPFSYGISRNGTTITMVQLSDSFVKMITTANKKELVIEKRNELSQRNGWKFGLNFSLGASTTQAGLLSIIGAGKSNVSEVVADLIQNNPGASPTGTPVVYYPSPVKTGVGILIGGFAQKSISTRSSILLGLNFKMLTSSMMTGTRVDSTTVFNSNNFASRNFYYRNGNQQKFKNHFYFIELPVSIKIQLNKQKKTPVYLTTGINISRLINANALQFDVTSGNYYRDNSLMNKTQLSGSLGVLFSLSSNAKNSLVIGPEMQYSFSKIANGGLYKNRHYSFIGITLQKTIGKK